MLQEAMYVRKSWLRRTAPPAARMKRLWATSEEVSFQFVVVLFTIFFFSAVKELWKSVKISPS